MAKPPQNRSAKDKKYRYPSPFCMRFSEDERRVLEIAAAGRPLAAYIRWLIFKQDMPAMPKKRTRSRYGDLDREVIGKLMGALGQSRISQNINQLAKAANSGSLPVNKEVTKALINATNAVQWMRKTLIKDMDIKVQEPEDDNNHDLEG